MARLNATVYVNHNGEITAFGPDSDNIPESVARTIGVHAWEGGVHPFPDADGDGVTDRERGTEPPRAGAGSSKDAWVAFLGEKRAEGTQVDVSDDAGRDEIIAALESADVIQPKQ